MPLSRLDPSDGLTPPGPTEVDIFAFDPPPPGTPLAPTAPAPADHFEMMDTTDDGMVTEEAMMDDTQAMLMTFNSVEEFLEYIGVDLSPPTGGSGGTFSVAAEPPPYVFCLHTEEYYYCGY